MSNDSLRSARLTVKKKLPPEMKLRRYLVMSTAYQSRKAMGFAALNPSYGLRVRATASRNASI
jgi:hypothetical protein